MATGSIFDSPKESEEVVQQAIDREDDGQDRVCARL
jgi:hypothetical protein